MSKYLTEESLISFLEVIYAGKTITKQYSIKYKGKRMAVDYAIFDGSVLIAVVEYDGYHHYTSALTQLRDSNLYEYCTLNKVKLVRIPYFIQINNETVKYLFGTQVDVGNINYKSGFWSTEASCVLPINFNRVGKGMYHRILLDLVRL